MTYKEDFESERKDRESIHARIADMETRYRHQAESLAEQLQKKADELQRHKDTLANTEELLQKQQQQMLAQIRQKEDELQIAFHHKQQLQVWAMPSFSLVCIHLQVIVYIAYIHVHVCL